MINRLTTFSLTPNRFEKVKGVVKDIVSSNDCYSNVIDRLVFQLFEITFFFSSVPSIYKEPWKHVKRSSDNGDMKINSDISILLAIRNKKLSNFENSGELKCKDSDVVF